MTHSTPNPLLIDLFRNTTEETIRPTLDRLFPEETEDLIAALRRVREMDPAPDLGLVLRLNRDEDDVVVGGRDPRTGKDYALDFLPWAAYLGLTVPDDVLNAFQAEEIIARILDEMTFFGPTEESAVDTLKEVLRLRPERGGESANVATS